MINFTALFHHKKHNAMNAIKFATLELSNGQAKETNVRYLERDKIANCPHYIFDPSHYHATLGCKCFYERFKEMKGYGYKWNEKKGQWV